MLAVSKDKYKPLFAFVQTNIWNLEFVKSGINMEIPRFHRYYGAYKPITSVNPISSERFNISFFKARNLRETGTFIPMNI